MTTLIHHAMEAAAERSPDAPALRFAKTELTYADLARRSDQVAAVLHEQGVRPGDRVGLYLNKSIEAVISLYGVMKAGAAYVPLDAGAPAARTLAVMEQCDLRALVSHPPKAKALSAILQGAKNTEALRCVIGLDAPVLSGLLTISWDDVAKAPAPKSLNLSSDDLAYILFTSGSTGAPKGIMHSHRSGLAYARFAADMYEVRPGDRLSNHPPLHFDMSIFDYVSGLISGACTVIIPEPYTKIPASLSKLIEDERLTHWYSVPFALTQLLERGVLGERDLTSLRWVVFAGEPFAAKHLKALMSLLPKARFSNSYGPSELNQCTYHHIGKDDLTDHRPPPIGCVWDGAEARVVDQDDRDVAPGEQGELLVQSPTMMQGYWGRPDLNAEAFFESPQADGETARFYRTGDLVVDEGDGIFRFLGRKDRQIKLRGFRIELDEIEAAITSHPAVDEAVALLVQGHDNQGSIVGALSLRPGCAAASADDIRADAAKRLPAYALPDRLEIYETLPRTPSDKIDRRTLAREFDRRQPAEGLAT